MRNISLKSDGVGDTLPAGDFNANLRTELQSIITDCGFTLDPEGGPNTDLDMLGKSIAVYSNASQYYADTGSADTYEINRVGNLQPLEQLIDGVIVYFKAANANTGPSTLNVDGMGVKDIVDNTGAALIGGEILSGQYVQARYNSATDDFEIIFSNSLSTWSNIGDDLVPLVSGSGALGGVSNLISGAYFADNAKVFLGNGQDIEIYHDGVDSFLVNQTGNLTLNNSSAGQLIFQTQDLTRWLINSSGHLIPGSAGSFNIGSTTAEVGNIYQGDSCYHYFGSDQDASILHNGTQMNIDCATGPLYLRTTSSNQINFSTNGSVRWYISSAGNLIPNTDAAYDIGSSSSGIDDIFQSTGSKHYFGDSQELEISHGTYTSTIKSTPGSGGVLDIITTNVSAIQFWTNNSSRWSITNDGDFVPIGSSLDVGSNVSPVDVLYYNTLTLVSDIRMKKDIQASLGLDFILKIDPISFKYEDDFKTKHKNRRYGVSAQQIKDIIDSDGIEFCGLIYDEENDIYSIDITQFIGPIIQSIKDLNDKIK